MCSSARPVPAAAALADPDPATRSPVARTHRHRSGGLQPLRRNCTKVSLLRGTVELSPADGTFDATIFSAARRRGPARRSGKMAW